ncbi:MAG: hypothetical protein RJA99_855 [Pseudomonadota bacterium]|jgi:hypothetical protein
MDTLDGIWTLIRADAQDADGRALRPPYGRHPMGTIVFSRGRMLAALCDGDAETADDGPRAYSSYGGTYRFDGRTLAVEVDIASDPSRIGGTQTRDVTLDSDRMTLRPPLRPYGKAPEQRSLVWQRIGSAR